MDPVSPSQLRRGTLCGRPAVTHANSCRNARKQRALRALLPVLSAVALIWAVARPAIAQWEDELSYGPFVIRGDFDLGPHEPLFQQLAGLQQNLTDHLGVPPAEEPIEVLVFKDAASYKRFLAANYPNLPYRRALFIKSGGVGRVMVHRCAEFEIDLRHESTHALLHASLPVVPLWLDEGLAKFYEVPPGARAFGSPFLKSVRWAAMFGLTPNLGKLERLSDFAAMGASEYRDAWAWVHFLQYESETAHQVLVAYLADLRAKRPPGSFEDRLKSHIRNTRGRFTSHFRNWR